MSTQPYIFQRAKNRVSRVPYTNYNPEITSLSKQISNLSDSKADKSGVVFTGSIGIATAKSANSSISQMVTDFTRDENNPPESLISRTWFTKDATHNWIGFMQHQVDTNNNCITILGVNQINSTTQTQIRLQRTPEGVASVTTSAPNESVYANQIDTRLASINRHSINILNNTNYYVSPSHTNASDTTKLFEGRGTVDLPFKTLSACINYITKYHSTNGEIWINVTEDIDCERLNINLGRIQMLAIKGRSATDRTVIRNVTSNVGTFFASSNGGILVFSNLEFVLDKNLTNLHSSSNNYIQFSNCTFRVPSTNTGFTGWMCGHSQNANIYFGGTNKIINESSNIPVGINISRMSHCWAWDAEIQFSGKFKYMFYLGSNSNYNGNGVVFNSDNASTSIVMKLDHNSHADFIYTTFTGTCTGKRYELTNDSSIATAGKGVDYIFGNTTGTVDSNSSYI